MTTLFEVYEIAYFQPSNHHYTFLVSMLIDNANREENNIVSLLYSTVKICWGWTPVTFTKTFNSD